MGQGFGESNQKTIRRPMDKPKTLYGWFSATQAKLGGTKIYRTLTGHTVILTTVSETEDHGCKWPDVIFVAEVVGGLVGQASKGEYAELDNLPFDEFVDEWKKIYDREERIRARSSNPKKWN
jgi:hypothetical protein